jgi:hypothetical protein
MYKVVAHDDLFTPPPQLQGLERGVDAVYALAADGVLRARTPKPQVSHYDVLNYGFRDYFLTQLRLVAAGRPDVYISRAFRSVGDRSLVLGFSAPLFDPAGKHVGVVCAAVKARATFGAVQMNCAGNGDCMTALLGPRDREAAGQALPDAISVLAAPGLADGEEKNLDPSLMRRVCGHLSCVPSDHDQFSRPNTAPLVIDGYRDPISHVSAIAAFAPVGQTGLIVVVATPDSAVRALTTQMTGRVKEFLWVPLLLGGLLFGALIARSRR